MIFEVMLLTLETSLKKYLYLFIFRWFDFKYVKNGMI